MGMGQGPASCLLLDRRWSTCVLVRLIFLTLLLAYGVRRLRREERDQVERTHPV